VEREVLQNVASAPLIPTDPFGGAVKPIPGIATSAIPAPTAPITPGSALTGAERYFGDKATSDLAAQRYADATGSTLGTSAMQTLGGISLQSAADEQEAIKAQQAAIDEKRERRKRLFEEIAERTLGRVNVKSGGLMQACWWWHELHGSRWNYWTYGCPTRSCWQRRWYER
jgi:hypothetical protein